MKRFIFVVLGITTIDFVRSLLVYLVAKSRNKAAIGDSDKEFCVSCHIETGYKKDSLIDSRLHYVEGQGQLCEKCGEYLFDEYLFDRAHQAH